MITKAPQVYMGLAQTTQFLQTFTEYPPSQKPDSWSVDKLTERFLKQAEDGR
jgi:arylsulfatase